MRIRDLAGRAVLIAAALTVVSAGVGQALIGGSEEIHACVGPTGIVRIVDPDMSCRSTETPLTWNVQGSTGATGPSGQGQPLVTHTRFTNQRLGPSSFAFVVARCNAGEIVTGGGFESDSGLVSVGTSAPIPVTDPPAEVVPTGWIIGARNTSPSVTIQVVAHAVCAPGDPG